MLMELLAVDFCFYGCSHRLGYTVPSLFSSLLMVRQRHKEADGRLLQKMMVLMLLTQIVSVEIL
jgi:hypothetical protein